MREISANDAPDAREGADEAHSVCAILKRVREAGSGTQLTVRDIVEALGDASFGPLLLVPALFAVTPLSGIPGVSTICGVCIALIAVQWQLHRRHVWLPGWIMRRHVGRDRFQRAIDAIRRPAAMLDRITKPRLSALVSPPFSLVIELLCLAAGLVMPFLEVVPMSSTMVGAAVSILAIATIARDGVLAAFGIAAIAAAGVAIFMIAGMI